jgi:hypothetical protein
LTERSKGFPRGYREGLLSALSAGFFFVLVGAIFVTTPNLLDKILAFFRDFDIVRVPNTPIRLPAPASPRAHSGVYSALALFSFVWSLFQIVMLVLRFIANSPLSKKTETAGNLVFWLGANFLVRSFLSETTTRSAWFEFWTAIIMLLGVSMIVRAIILAVQR